MHVTRMKEDISAINYEIFRRKNIIVKFRVKTYYETTNNNQSSQLEYYHKEYVYNSNKRRMATMTITPKSYIQIDVINENEKNMFFMGEAMKNKFIKKLSKMVALLEAYDDHEIDIIAVDASGTHIKNGFPKSEKVIMGKSEIHILTCIREELCDVGVALKFDTAGTVILSIYDFLELYYKLKDLNYNSTAILLLTYLGSPELGKHETDFRQPGLFESDYEISTEHCDDPMNDFSGIKDNRTTTINKKINW